MVAIGSFAVTSGCVGGWLSWHGRVKELGTGKAPRGAVRCARHTGEVTSKGTTPPVAHDHRIAAKPRLSGIKVGKYLCDGADGFAGSPPSLEHGSFF